MESRCILMVYELISGRIETAKKVIIYGPEGIGKSTFAANMPDPIFIDTEHSTDGMDVRRLPFPTSWEMLMDEVRHVRDTKGICKTLAIDTGDWAEKLCVTSILSKHKKTGIEDFGYGKGYVYLSEEFGKLLNLLEEVKSRGINIIISCHTTMRKVEQPDEMTAYDRYELKMSKQVSPMVKEWADMILFANYKTIVVVNDNKNGKAQGGKRVMYTTHHPCWDAKNRYNLPDELPFAYEHIAHLFGGVSTPVQAPPPVVPTPAPVIPPTKSNEVKQAIPTTQTPVTPATIPPPPLTLPEGFTLVGDSKETLIANGIQSNLIDLMVANQVTIKEVQDIVGVRGYFPADMPIRDYPTQFIEGCLISAWPQVFKMIADNRDLPF